MEWVSLIVGSYIITGGILTPPLMVYSTWRQSKELDFESGAMLLLIIAILWPLFLFALLLPDIEEPQKTLDHIEVK